MGVESKIQYRNGFLRSEKWQCLRAETLARSDGKCLICGERNLSNDVHHVVYADKWCETKPAHLFTLCRDCHELIHRCTQKKGAEFLKTAKAEFMNRRLLIRSVIDICWLLSHPELPEINSEDTKQVEEDYLLQPKPLTRLSRTDSESCRTCASADAEIVNVIGMAPKQIKWPMLIPMCSWCKKKFQSVVEWPSVSDPERAFFKSAKKALNNVMGKKAVDSLRFTV